jgi:hypothetical protein
MSFLTHSESKSLHSKSKIPKKQDVNYKNEKNVTNDNSFILKKTKKSGNYTILRKTKINGCETLQRVKYTMYNVYLPYGKEEYNDNIILNAIINDSNNLNYNLLVTLNRITKTFNELNTIDICKQKYGIDNKIFFPFIKEIQTDPKELPINPDTNITGKNIQQYSVRLYFKYGAKISHAKYVGELFYDQLKGKYCNIDVDLGSLWVNDNTMMYGINIYITHITVLN